MDAPQHLLHPGSCEKCNWYGYKGRSGIFEVAAIDDELGALICSKPHHRELVESFRRKGVRSIARHGAEKVAKGISSMEELFRVCGLPRGETSVGQRSDTPAVGAIAG